MKLLRPVLAAGILAGAFFCFTTYSSGPYRPWTWMGRSSKVEITEAAGGASLDSEEQNNIGVYHKNIGAIVNITSRAVAFDFFYGLVPQEGQGSGFIIDKEGHILTRSEEHTSELQSQSNLVCRLLLEKKKTNIPAHIPTR